jgi:ABC-type phosphate transport system substrate-binding protein
VTAKFDSGKAGLDCVLDRSCQIAVAAAEQLIKVPAGILAKPFALGVVIFAATNDTKLTNITREQVVGIFSGKLKNWKELGGPDLKIEAWRRRSRSGSSEILSRLTPISPELREVKSRSELSYLARAPKGVITYVDRSSAKELSGKYNLTHKFFLLRRADERDLNVNEYFDYLLSHQKDVLNDTGLTAP